MSLITCMSFINVGTSVSQGVEMCQQYMGFFLPEIKNPLNDSFFTSRNNLEIVSNYILPPQCQI